MKSSKVAHILHMLCKKALYSYLVVCTRHPLYLFVPCWLKYQFTGIVNPVLFAQKSNVTFFPECYPVTSAFQSCVSLNYISVKSYVRYLPANEHFQFLSIITKSLHSVAQLTFLCFIYFLYLLITEYPSHECQVWVSVPVWLRWPLFLQLQVKHLQNMDKFKKSRKLVFPLPPRKNLHLLPSLLPLWETVWCCMKHATLPVRPVTHFLHLPSSFFLLSESGEFTEKVLSCFSLQPSLEILQASKNMSPTAMSFLLVLTKTGLNRLCLFI